MNNTKEMQNRGNIIQTVQLNEKEFNSLEYFLGVKADSIIIESYKAYKDCWFCFNEIDKEIYYQIEPDYINFVKV